MQSYILLRKVLYWIAMIIGGATFVAMFADRHGIVGAISCGVAFLSLAIWVYRKKFSVPNRNWP
jgi:hypothetical protein